MQNNKRRTPIKQYILNDRIRASEVRLIDSDGAQLGIVPIEEAKNLSENRSLDLLLITDETTPPVCKIVDIGQFKYEQQKKEKLARKKSKVQVTKEVKLSPRISEHDYQVRFRMAQKFLTKGCCVKVTIWFRGRLVTRKDLGKVVLDRFVEELKEFGNPTSSITDNHRSISITLSPV